MTLVAVKKQFLAFCTLYLSCAFARFHLSVKLYHTFLCVPFRLERLNYLKDYLSSSVRFLLKNTFFYSIVKDLLESFDSWSVWMDSNHRPRAYQARALAT